MAENGASSRLCELRRWENRTQNLRQRRGLRLTGSFSVEKDKKDWRGLGAESLGPANTWVPYTHPHTCGRPRTCPRISRLKKEAPRGQAAAPPRPPAGPATGCAQLEGQVGSGAHGAGTESRLAARSAPAAQGFSFRSEMFRVLRFDSQCGIKLKASGVIFPEMVILRFLWIRMQLALLGRAKTPGARGGLCSPETIWSRQVPHVTRPHGWGCAPPPKLPPSSQRRCGL